MERDINVGMNKSLDCPYIVRCEFNRFFFLMFFTLYFFTYRYTERFEQDGNIFVVMNYMENGIILFISWSFPIVFLDINYIL
jgi:hypothetical protein